MKRRTRRTYGLVVSTAAVVAVLASWQLASTRGWVDSLFLPPPSELLSTWADLWRNGYGQIPLWEHVGISLARALSAFALSIVIGVPLGLAMGLNATLAAILNPFVQFLRPLPKIALIPLAIVWLGIDEASKFFLIFISTFLNVLVGAAAAVQGVPQGYIRVARTLGLTRRQVFWRVVFPHCAGDIFTTIRLSIGIGWTSLVAAELVASTSGVGWLIVNAGSYLRTDVVLIGILILGVLGYLLDLILVTLQRWCVPWAGKQ
ncbi:MULTISPECIES: ABC transporter permease [unclassified Achromobacter]|uniref:ABC transporter permease n=1 Tax=unclassified Achromobacter TaxID=2626865 RepID=UPI000B51DABC|nr:MULTISPECIES: ABC transporter permease [unclassified Achromobacter]OWT71493.1 taurine ABC transporter permease [Achromobacter sp. HZ34]OWT73150.1 taurine ABC transporter permease [Achromobacter sp. HZ28]